jgi:hypothetical protein
MLTSYLTETSQSISILVFYLFLMWIFEIPPGIIRITPDRFSDAQRTSLRRRIERRSTCYRRMKGDQCGKVACDTHFWLFHRLEQREPSPGQYALEPSSGCDRIWYNLRRSTIDDYIFEIIVRRYELFPRNWRKVTERRPTGTIRPFNFVSRNPGPILWSNW